MTVSTHNLTRTEILSGAFRLIGKQSPTNDEMAQAVKDLNSLIKRIDIAGQWLWAVDTTPTQLDVVSSQTEYSTGTAPAGIAADILALEAIWIQEGETRTYLRLVDKPEALTSYEHESTGEPYLAYLEKAPLLANQKLLLLPVPGGNYTIKYNYRRRLYDFTLPSSNPDFPPEWQHPLQYQLAEVLADQFGLPMDQRQWINQKSQFYLKEMLAANTKETKPTVTPSVYF